MDKPLLFASSMLTACVGATLARSYFKQDEINWAIELASGVGIGFVTYALAQWQQQKTESKSESDNS